ncbi:MAG: hypothetical protein V4492_04620 [Chlamydiota bacterium]
MQIKIEDSTIRQNIEFFLEILRRAKRNESSAAATEQKVYHACVHRQTGQLFFDEISKDVISLGEKEWKPVIIRYAFDPQEGEIAFEVDEEESQQKTFATGDLSPLACRIMFQTLKVLNEVCHRLKGPSLPDAKISVLTRLKIDTGVPAADRNLVISAWHQADRFAAEELLWEKPVGAYLFRKDEYAQILEAQLQGALHHKIKCITLTFKDENFKMSDLTLVNNGHEWQIYNDDPSLEQPGHADLMELVRSLSVKLKYPLFH